MSAVNGVRVFRPGVRPETVERACDGDAHLLDESDPGTRPMRVHLWVGYSAEYEVGRAKQPQQIVSWHQLVTEGGMP